MFYVTFFISANQSHKTTHPGSESSDKPVQSVILNNT